MVKTKKPTWLIFLLVCLLSLLTLMLSGCKRSQDPWKLKKEDQGFYYYVVGKNGYPEEFLNKGKGAVILGMKSDNTYEDELVIPEKLGGYPVKQIGTTYVAPLAVDTRYYGINVSNKKIKKIIVNNAIGIYGNGLDSFRGEIVLNAKIRTNSDLFVHCSVVRINVDVEPFYLDTYFTEVESFYRWLTNHSVKEIKFDATEGQQKTYTTLIKGNRVLPEPEQPTKEGYTFEGWYKENTYETQWNFEEDIATDNMTLYAKWEESAV